MVDQCWRPIIIVTSLIYSKRYCCRSVYLNLPAYQLAWFQHIQINRLLSLGNTVFQHIPHHSFGQVPERFYYKLCAITYILLQ